MSQTNMIPVILFVTKDGLALIENKHADNHLSEDSVENLLLHIKSKNELQVVSCLEKWHRMVSDDFVRTYGRECPISQATFDHAVVECLVGIKGLR